MIGKYEMFIHHAARELGTDVFVLVDSLDIKPKYREIVKLRLEVENNKHKHTNFEVMERMHTGYGVVQNALKSAVLALAWFDKWKKKG